MTLRQKLEHRIAQAVAVKAVVDAAKDVVAGVQEHGGFKNAERCSREWAKLSAAVDRLTALGRIAE